MFKPDWDTYFIAQTFLIAQRSIDPSTKHGCVWVSKKNKVLSVGYNGPIQGVDDAKIPLVRGPKYYHLIHSELNCIISYNGSESQIDGSKMYITGRPCHNCLRTMIQKGIKNIIYANVYSYCLDNQEIEAQNLMLELNPDVKLIEFKDINKVKELLKQTISYIELKEGNFPK